MAIVRSLALAVATLLAATTALAQQPVSRLKGRLVTERGEPVKDAEVRAEAFFGAAAGTFPPPPDFFSSAMSLSAHQFCLCFVFRH